MKIKPTPTTWSIFLFSQLRSMYSIESLLSLKYKAWWLRLGKKALSRPKQTEGQRKPGDKASALSRIRMEAKAFARIT